MPPTPFLGGGAARGVRLDLPPGSVLMRKEWTHGRTGTAAQRPWFDSWQNSLAPMAGQTFLNRDLALACLAPVLYLNGDLDDGCHKCQTWRAIQKKLGLIVVFLLPRSQPWNFTWACWGDRRLGLARGCRWRGESRGDEGLERVASVHLGPVQDQDHLACPRDWWRQRFSSSAAKETVVIGQRAEATSTPCHAEAVFIGSRVCHDRPRSPILGFKARRPNACGQWVLSKLPRNILQVWGRASGRLETLTRECHGGKRQASRL